MAFSINKMKRTDGALYNKYTSDWQPKHKEITQFIIPERGRYDDESTKNDGKKRFGSVIEHTAGVAVGTYAASLLDSLSSPTNPWYKMESRSKELMEIPAVKRHFEEVNRIMNQTMHDTNFYNSIADFYEEGVSFGTAAMFIDSDPVDLLRFTTFTMGGYTIAADSNARVNRFSRHYSDTVDNIVDKFGEENVSQKIKGKTKTNGHNYVDLVHTIEPNRDRDTSKSDNLNMPFRSVYYERGGSDTESPLRISGYEELPVIVARLKTVGTEVYGQSPCNRILGIVKSIQEMQKDFLRASKKDIDPVVTLPEDQKNRRLGAGSVVYHSKAQGAQPGKALYQVNYDYQANLLAQEKIERAINKIMNVDLFAAISNLDRSRMTATEIAQRVAEAARMLVAVVTRFLTEALKPALERIYKILDRAGQFPEPPEELIDQDIDILFVSALALAQQAVGIAAIEQMIDAVKRIAEIKPSVVDKFDADQTVDELGRMTGVASGVVVDDQTVAELRAAEAARETQERTAEIAAQMADSAQKLGNTPMDKNTALDRVTGGLQDAAR